MSAGVGVLAVMDRLCMLATDKGAGGHEAREARAAVDELIEACKERNEAESQYGLAEEFYGEDSNHKEMRAARGRMIRATKRYVAALARCGGAP